MQTTAVLCRRLIHSSPLMGAVWNHKNYFLFKLFFADMIHTVPLFTSPLIGHRFAVAFLWFSKHKVCIWSTLWFLSYIVSSQLMCRRASNHFHEKCIIAFAWMFCAKEHQQRYLFEWQWQLLREMSKKEQIAKFCSNDFTLWCMKPLRKKKSTTFSLLWSKNLQWFRVLHKEWNIYVTSINTELVGFHCIISTQPSPWVHPNSFSDYP